MKVSKPRGDQFCLTRWIPSEHVSLALAASQLYYKAVHKVPMRRCNSFHTPTRGHRPLSRLSVECCVGYECSLSREEVNAHLDDATRTWNVTDETLTDPGIQAIVNCTDEGDTISLQTTTPVKPSERIVIPWKLTITGTADNSMNEEAVIMTCPDGDGLFLLR